MSSDDSSREFIQLIDKDETYNANLNAFLQKHPKLSKLDYHVLSVFGPQSSGKSTLLNKLFGTHFQTMDETQGFSQVTQGIFLASVDPSLLVLDVEGTDSPERQRHGDEGQAFERRISLFVLAVSEVLLVNMWAKDVNRYQASNYSLLKTVFELNLQLFYGTSEASKTLLFFVIRDYDGSVPQEKVEDQIKVHLDRIWDGLMKPRDKEHVKVSDLFDVQFEFLPHKVYKGEEFENSIQDMKKKYFTDDDEHFLFKEEYHKRVPIDGFEHYTKNIWDQILKNKDLDIPAQKQILAHFRCNEISQEVHENFETKYLQPWALKTKNNEMIPNFGDSANNAITEITNAFNERSSLYVTEVVERVASQLQAKMEKELLNIFLGQVNLIRRHVEDSFRKHFNSKIKDAPNHILERFNSQSEKIKQQFLNEFQSRVEACMLSKDDNEPVFEEEDKQAWDISAIQQELKDSMNLYLQDVRQKQIKLMTDQQQEIFSLQIERLLTTPRKNGLLDQPTEKFWEALRDDVSELLNENERDKWEKNVYETYAFSEEEQITFRSSMRQHARSCVGRMLRDYAKYLSAHMVKVFDKQFPPSNLTGISEDQLEDAFENARADSLILMDICFVDRFESSLDEVTLSIPSVLEVRTDRKLIDYPTGEGLTFLIEEGDAREIFKDFSHEIEMKLVRAKHERERLRATQTSIPWWIYIVLVVLGWNELMYVLRNPLLLLLVIIVVVLFGSQTIKVRLEDYIKNGENLQVVFALRFLASRLPEGWINIDDSPKVTSEKGEKKDQ